jgi:hypothetical protein
MSSSYELFDKLDCRFSFTSDLWTNKDKDGFDGSYISLYWCQLKFREKIINFTILPSPHIGLNIADSTLLYYI